MITEKEFLNNDEYFMYNLATIPESTQIKIIKNNINQYCYIKNKTKFVKDLYHIHNDAKYIKQLKNLTEQQIKDCIEVNPYVLLFIKNTTDEMKLFGIKKDPSIIKYFKNVSTEFIIKSLDVNKRTYLYLKQNQINDTIIDKIFQYCILSETWCVVAIKIFKIKITSEFALKYFKKFGILIKYIERDLTKEEQFEVCKNNINDIKYIKNKSDELKIYAIDYIIKNFNHSFDIIKSIENLSIDLQKKLIDDDYEYIKCFNNPTEEVMLYAIEKNKYAFEYLKTKTRKTTELYLKKNGFDIGSFNEMKISRKICSTCNEICVYKYKEGLYDGCPRFIEHLTAFKK